MTTQNKQINQDVHRDQDVNKQIEIALLSSSAAPPSTEEILHVAPSLASKIRRIRAQKRDHAISPRSPNTSLIEDMGRKERSQRPCTNTTKDSTEETKTSKTNELPVAETTSRNVTKAWSQRKWVTSGRPDKPDAALEMEDPAKSASKQRHLSAAATAKLMNRKNVKSRQNSSREDSTQKSSPSKSITTKHDLALALKSRRKDKTLRHSIDQMSSSGSSDCYDSTISAITDTSNESIAIRSVLEPPGIILNSSSSSALSVEKATPKTITPQNETPCNTLRVNESVMATKSKVSLKMARRRLGSGFCHSFYSSRQEESGEKLENQDQTHVIDLQIQNSKLETLNVQLEGDRQRLIVQLEELKAQGGLPHDQSYNKEQIGIFDEQSAFTATTASDGSAITVLRSNTADEDEGAESMLGKEERCPLFPTKVAENMTQSQIQPLRSTEDQIDLSKDSSFSAPTYSPRTECENTCQRSTPIDSSKAELDCPSNENEIPSASKVDSTLIKKRIQRFRVARCCSQRLH